MSTPVRWIAKEDELAEAVDALRRHAVLCFDTEFDSFNRRYGFTLLLIQVFDGETVWVIDPLALTDLSSLWKVFEDPAVMKVGYAMGEDVRLLKTMGCSPVNLFDIQVSRQLSDRMECGLAKALLEDLGVEMDKSSQTSDWGKRPLSAVQMAYLANDVVHLDALRLYNSVFENDAFLAGIFRDEMRLLEQVEIAERTIELTRAQQRRYTEECQQALLGLLTVRDEIARKLNVPTNYVVQTEQLEWIMEHRDEFLRSPFGKGFHPRLKGHEGHKRRFLDAVRNVPASCPQAPKVRGPRVDFRALREEKLDYEERITKDVFLPIEEHFLAQYGEHVVRFLLRGVRRELVAQEFRPDNMRPYQWAIVRDLAARMNLTLPVPFVAAG